MKEYQFKNYQLSSDEKLWLNELRKFNFTKIDVKRIMVKLWGKISKDFDPTKLNRRLYSTTGITLLGLYYLEPQNILIKSCEVTLQSIKEHIIKDSTIQFIDFTFVRSVVPISDFQAQIVLKFLFELHFFTSSIADSDNIKYAQLNFDTGPTGFNKILSFENMDETLEEFFIENDPNRYNSIISEKLPDLINSLPKIEGVDEVWNDIFKKYGLNKQAMGKKFNFVKDKHKRKIIFRDIQEAYILANNGFSKPAVLLAGGVIEELLRIYLDSKKVKPKNNSFDEYLKSCESNNLLTTGINRLSESVRHFRNLVHLEREDNPKKTISKPNAQGAVASIFSIINDFQ